MFGEPFDVQLSAILKPLIAKAIKENNIQDVDLHTEKVVVCMEGPQVCFRQLFVRRLLTCPKVLNSS